MTVTENSLNSFTKKKAITAAPASPLHPSDNHTLRKHHSHSSLPDNNNNKNPQPTATKSKSANLSSPKEDAREKRQLQSPSSPAQKPKPSSSTALQTRRRDNQPARQKKLNTPSNTKTPLKTKPVPAPLATNPDQKQQPSNSATTKPSSSSSPGNTRERELQPERQKKQKELNNARSTTTTIPLKANPTSAPATVNKTAEQKQQLQNQTKAISTTRKSTLGKERVKIVTSVIDYLQYSKAERSTIPTTAKKSPTPSRYLRGEVRASTSEIRRIAADKRKDYLAAGVTWNPSDASHFAAAKKKALKNNLPTPISSSNPYQKFQPLTSITMRSSNTSEPLNNSFSPHLVPTTNTSSVVRSTNYSPGGSVKSTNSKSYPVVISKTLEPGQEHITDDRFKPEFSTNSQETGWQVIDRKQKIEILNQPSKLLKSVDLFTKDSGDGLADLAIFNKPPKHRYDISFQKNIDGRQRAVIQVSLTAPSLYEKQVANQPMYVDKSGAIQLESTKSRTNSDHFQAVDRNWFGAKPPS